MEAAVVVATVAAASFVAVTAIAATAATRALRCKIVHANLVIREQIVEIIK